MSWTQKSSEEVGQAQAGDSVSSGARTPAGKRESAAPESGSGTPAEALPAGRESVDGHGLDFRAGAPASKKPGTAATAADADEAAPTAQSARQLVDTQGKKLNLVDNRTLMPAITRAMGFALDQHARNLDLEVKKAIVRQARENLVGALRSSSKKIRGLPEQAFLQKVKAERDKIVVERQRAERQLTELLSQLEAKRNELHIRSQMIASESAAAGAMHDRLLAEQLRIAFEEVGDDPDKLLVRVTEIALRSSEGERAKTVDAQVSEHQREIENFERRIAKLTQSLQMTEEEMRRIAAAKNIELGVASLFRTVQGLDGSDSQTERKKELMAGIFEANLHLKQAIDAALPG